MKILLWIIMWIVGMGAYYIFFRPRGILYKNSPSIITGWYTALIIVVVLILVYMQSEWVLTFSPGVIMVAPCIGAMLFWFSLKKRSENRNIQRNWMITKSSEIIFQQVMILWLTRVLFFPGLSDSYQVLIFSLVFFIAHLPIYFFFSFKKASTYVVPSILGGIVFMLPIFFLPGGIYLSLGIHFLFYAFLAYQGTVWGSEKHFSNF